MIPRSGNYDFALTGSDKQWNSYIKTCINTLQVQIHGRVKVILLILQTNLQLTRIMGDLVLRLHATVIIYSLVLMVHTVVTLCTR